MLKHQLKSTGTLKKFETYKAHNSRNKSGITACVVAPALNEENYIGSFLESIKIQKTDYPVFVVISDNKSIDKTCDIAEKLGANVIETITQGIGPARQRGINFVKSMYPQNHEKVIIIQSDTDSCLVNENYVQKVCQVYEKDPSIEASVGPTQYHISRADNIQETISGGREFKACFGTLSLKELFEECGRDISDYLTSPPYRLFAGANSTYRLSVFDKNLVAYPQDKSWESVILSIRLQQHINPSQIAFIDEQAISTSNRSYIEESGITTDAILNEIKKKRYITPFKSPDSLSPLDTLKSLLLKVDRETYSLSDYEIAIPVTISDINGTNKSNYRILDAKNASTGKLIPNKFVTVKKTYI